MKIPEETQRLLTPDCSPGPEESTSENSGVSLNKARKAKLLAEIKALQREIASRTRELAEKQKEYRSIAITPPESQRAEDSALSAENQAPAARWWLRPCEPAILIEADEADARSEAQ